MGLAKTVPLRKAICLLIQYVMGRIALNSVVQSRAEVIIIDSEDFSPFSWEFSILWQTELRYVFNSEDMTVTPLSSPWHRACHRPAFSIEPEAISLTEASFPVLII